MTALMCPDNGLARTRCEAQQMHLALFYDSPDEYAEGVLRFAGPAIEADEPVAVAVPRTTIRVHATLDR